jgi:hypothetical protein
VVAVKRGVKVARITVKAAASKVAAVTGTIAQPKAIVADAGSAAASPKGKRSKAPAPVKLAEKPAAKPQAKAPTAKKSKGVQVADARGARK